MKKEISVVVTIGALLSFTVWLVFYLAHMPLDKGETSCVVLISLGVATMLKVLWKAVQKRKANAQQPKNTRNGTLILLLLLLVTISGCARQESALPPPPRETARSFLTGAEESGYGLYSYLLLGAHPSDGTEHEKYLEAIKVYLARIDIVEAVAKYTARSNINITYLPMAEQPPSSPSADWLLDHYDFPRARVLLDKVGSSLRNGPYIISVARPLSDSPSPIGHHLYQDLSNVPTNVIHLWVGAFMKQAAEEKFWEPQMATIWLLKLRSSIAVMAIAVPDISNSLKEWLKWSD